MNDDADPREQILRLDGRALGLESALDIVAAAIEVASHRVDAATAGGASAEFEAIELREAAAQNEALKAVLTGLEKALRGVSREAEEIKARVGPTRSSARH